MLVLDLAIVAVIGWVLARFCSPLWVAGMLIAIVLPPFVLVLGTTPDVLPGSTVPLFLIFDAVLVLAAFNLYAVIIPRNQSLKALVYPSSISTSPTRRARFLGFMMSTLISALFIGSGCLLGFLVYCLSKALG